MTQYTYEIEICMLLMIVNLSDEEFNNAIDFSSIKVVLFIRTFGQIFKPRHYKTEHKEYICPRVFIYL